MKNAIPSYDPSNNELLGQVLAATNEQITQVVSQAHAAGADWREQSPKERVNLLKRAYANAQPHINDLAVLLSREMGKDIQRATGEVNGTIHGGPHLAQEAMEALKTSSPGHGTQIQYRPLGVAAVISPWNYPLAMANNLIVPALVAGNTIVFKPSEQTPLIAQAFVDHLNGILPKHVLQIIHGDGEQGRMLVESNVNVIGFTGSQAVGREIMARASDQLKRLVMELGGNDPMIVMKDADIETAARFAVASSFENAGQMCISTERIYVDQQIADQFEKRVVEIATMYQVGPWNMRGVNIGPIINSDQHGKIVRHIRDAEEKGAKILLGGSDQEPPYINPTVITGLTPDMEMSHSETFGPVVAMARYSDIQEAVSLANNSDYGLGAVVFGSRDAQGVADQLEAGMVGINQGVGGSGGAPWVGAKQSGFGFHGSPGGHQQFAQVRVVSG